MKRILVLHIFGSLLLVLGTSVAQIKITGVEKLPLSASSQWSQPRFSPNGEYLYYTTVDGDGIWEYSIQARSSRLITDDPKSGFSFSLSDDGTRLAYRRTTYPGGAHERVQEIVEMDLSSRSSTVLASAKDLSAPTFAGSEPVYSLHKEVKNLARTTAAGIMVLGIEDTKIAVSKNGRRVKLVLHLAPPLPRQTTHRCVRGRPRSIRLRSGRENPEPARATRRADLDPIGQMDRLHGRPG